ncbi:MAG: hypothetical protein FJ096_05280 [Deltaproteobacteria bacterium]|nr:hypothetical protein [Deltaproteobacteria bacterium]
MRPISPGLALGTVLPLALLSAFCGGKAVVDGPPGSGGAGGAVGSTGFVATVVTAQTGVTTGGQNFASCATPGSCTLAINTCCGTCGKPTLAAFDAINEASIEPHRAAVCPEPQPCPDCAGEANPNLFAYCEPQAGECRGANLPETDLVICTKDEDCSLRNGTGCCICGDSGGWVAVSTAKIKNLEALVCEPEQACPGCVPDPPDGVGAACVEGRCELKPVLPPGG